MVQAVVLAGGRGERLRPLTDIVPKPMVKIDAKPFLQYQLEHLRELGIRDIILCVGYLKSKILDYFGDGSQYGLNIAYSVEEHPLGTGGALKRAQRHLDGTYILLNGDTYIPMNYLDLLSSFGNEETLGVMVVYDNKDDIVPNNVKVAPDRRILGYGKNKLSEDFDGVDAGVYVFRKELADLFPEERAFSLEEEVFPKVIEKGGLMGHITDTRFYDIGTPERLQVFRNAILGKIFR